MKPILPAVEDKEKIKKGDSEIIFKYYLQNYDFIKMGAPESFIKHRDTTDIIKIGALPLGIIQNVETKAKEVYFSSGDKIVLVSDGISDAFKNIEELQDYVNNISSQSPQSIADEIVQYVLNLNKNVARDDMTVIVAKIFEK